MFTTFLKGRYQDLFFWTPVDFSLVAYSLSNRPSRNQNCHLYIEHLLCVSICGIYLLIGLQLAG